MTSHCHHWPIIIVVNLLLLLSNLLLLLSTLHHCCWPLFCYNLSIIIVDLSIPPLELSGRLLVFGNPHVTTSSPGLGWCHHWHRKNKPPAVPTAFSCWIAMAIPKGFCYLQHAHQQKFHFYQLFCCWKEEWASKAKIWFALTWKAKICFATQQRRCNVVLGEQISQAHSYENNVTEIWYSTIGMCSLQWQGTTAQCLSIGHLNVINQVLVTQFWARLLNGSESLAMQGIQISSVIQLISCTCQLFYT